MQAIQAAIEAVSARQSSSESQFRVEHQVSVMQTLCTKAITPDAQSVLSSMEVLADAARASSHPDTETFHTLLNDLKARVHLGGKALCVLFISYLGTDAQKKHQSTLLAFDKQALKLAEKDVKRPFNRTARRSFNAPYVSQPHTRTPPYTPPGPPPLLPPPAGATASTVAARNSVRTRAGTSAVSPVALTSTWCDSVPTGTIASPLPPLQATKLG